MLNRKEKLLCLRLWVELKVWLGEDISDIFAKPLSYFDYSKIIEQIWEKAAEANRCELVNDYPELIDLYNKL